MKFMKLGSKPDSFQSDTDNNRYVATELATDVVVAVGNVKFYLHKFPLLSKSVRLQKLVASSNEESNADDEIHVTNIPGGPAAFEICAKFCYGMTITLNAYNVVAARCAAEYLEMYETVEKGNLVYKIEVFLNTSIFRSWKDSIIVLQTTRSLLPSSEELKVVGRSIDSIASKASMDTLGVKWSYTYNRDKVSSENGARMPQMVPKDWWVEDLCELHIDLFKRIISTIKTKGRVSPAVIGEALDAYAMRRIPGFNKSMIPISDFSKHRLVLETIIWMLPTEKQSLSCSFLIKLLKAALTLECGEKERTQLVKRIGQHLEHARVADLLIRGPANETTMYDVDFVRSLIEGFVTQDCKKIKLSYSDNAFEETVNAEFVSDASKAMVAKLIDEYLAEIARDPNLPLPKFLGIAEMVSSFPRPSHDMMYRAIDMFLKEHSGITKSERKRLCRLMDCRKLSPEACKHAVQNERLPLRVVVQVLFFEQARASATTSAGGIPPLPGPPGSIKALPQASCSYGSSRTTTTTTHTEEDWDSVPTTEDVKGGIAKPGSETAALAKPKGMVISKMFSRLWSGKDSNGEISSSDMSESPGSATAEETKSTPSTGRRRSMS